MEQNLTQEEKKPVETAVPTIISNPMVSETKEEPKTNLPEIKANPAVILNKEAAKVVEDDITIIDDVPAIKEVPLETPKVPEETKEDVKKMEPTLEKMDESKKSGGLLWKILTIVFLLTTLLMAFLYFTKKELLTVVLIGKDNAVQIEKVEKGNLASRPNINTDGFIGWFSDNKEFDFNTKIEKDTVIFAKYDERPTYTVTFNTDGGSEVASIKVKEKDKVQMPTNPTKDGYLFTDWTLNGNVYDFNTPVMNDIELKATWRINDNTVMVHFDTTGGSSMSAQKVKIGETLKKPKDPTRSGYNFKEWQLNGTTFDFSTKMDKDITLTATWTEKKKVTITFDSNGGSVVATKNVYENEAVGNLPTPTKSGFVFSRWTLNGKTFNSKSAISGNVTVKAEWKTVDEANYDKALAAIKSSYDITKDGQVINVTSNGCTIKHDEIKTTDKNITFHITCGSKSGTKTAKINLKTPTYKYTVTPSGNMVNSYVTIKGVNSGTLYKNGEHIGDITNGKALVNDADIKGNPTLQLKIPGDSTTYKVVKG